MSGKKTRHLKVKSDGMHIRIMNSDTRLMHFRSIIGLEDSNLELCINQVKSGKGINMDALDWEHFHSSVGTIRVMG